LVYRCDEHVIDSALERLKEDGLVAHDAWFNEAAPEGLRREVAYRDFDFLSRLCRVAETETVRSILAWLKQAGVVTWEASYDERACDAFRLEVKETFSMPGSSITPVMERLLYALSAVRRPKRVVGLGTYYGYALVFAIGASCGQGRSYEPHGVVGIDIDEEATDQARRNVGRLAHTGHVELMVEDAMAAVERLEGPFDYVYIDVESRSLGKGLYLDLLRRLSGKIEAEGWVLAHDTTASPFAKELQPYLAYVRDHRRFRESISFDVDPYGLELSVKR
jgi:predicted O-methyltransferase YrrM